MKKIFWFGHPKSYSGLIGVLSPQGKIYLFSKRSGQTWIAQDLPGIPGRAYGHEYVGGIGIAGVWQLDKKKNTYVPYNKAASLYIKIYKNVNEKNDVFSIVKIGKNYYLRWQDNLHRLKWRRSSKEELSLMTYF
jgi:hypothetical protein